MHRCSRKLKLSQSLSLKSAISQKLDRARAVKPKV